MNVGSVIRVVGVGSPNGDDALGWEVLRQVEQKITHPTIEFHTLEGGQRLLELLDGRGTLLLVDAVAPAGSPGTVRRTPWPDASLQVFRPGSTHSLGVAEALALADTLDLLPPRVILWGIEGESFSIGMPLSQTVVRVLSEAALKISLELEALLHE